MGPHVHTADLSPEGCSTQSSLFSHRHTVSHFKASCLLIKTLAACRDLAYRDLMSNSCVQTILLPQLLEYLGVWSPDKGLILALL